MFRADLLEGTCVVVVVGKVGKMKWFEGKMDSRCRKRNQHSTREVTRQGQRRVAGRQVIVLSNVNRDARLVFE